MKKFIFAALLVATTGVLSSFTTSKKGQPVVKHDTTSDRRNLGTADDRRNLGTADDRRNLGTADDRRNLGTADDRRNLGTAD